MRMCVDEQSSPEHSPISSVTRMAGGLAANYRVFILLSGPKLTVLDNEN
jgi:hypothetical protein